MWVFILGFVIGAGTGIFSLFFVAEISERRDDKKRIPAHFPKEHRQHRKHLDSWKQGWDDLVDGTVIVGSEAYRERPNRWYSRDVSAYSAPEWEAYMAGRSAATDEKNRREIVKKARIDQIDADNAKQARYQAALAEVREEIYGKETE